MLASFEYKLSKDDYLRGLQAVTKSIVTQNPSRRRQIWEQFALLGLVLIIASLLNPDSLDAILLTLVLTLVGGCIVQNRLARRWREITFDPARSDIVISMDEHGVETRQADAERRYSWNAVRRVHELPEAVVLEFADWHAVAMPDNLWSGPEERAKFVQRVRSSAPQLLPDLPTASRLTGRTLLLCLGAVACGLMVMTATEAGISRAGINDCSCVFRHSFPGQLLGVAPFITYFAALPVAWLSLRWLDRRRPRIGAAVAIGLIALFVVSQTVPAFLQIYRFFSQPVP
jgi:hypothetical protein